MNSGDSPSGGRKFAGAAKAIIVSSVMFTFISYWRAAAVVLCDLASTAYYIGGIVEQSVGPAAPWFILAVMIFSYAVRSVYIESCSLFVRGGVYRVVKEAMGGFLAKLSVSALMFDYILTGPISGVSAGQYIMSLVLDVVSYTNDIQFDPATRVAWKSWGAVLIACLITLYFFRQNLIGIHESSDKALKIMIATTVMVVLILGWCGLTLWMDGPHNALPSLPDLSAKMNPDTGEKESPLGFLADTKVGEQLGTLKGHDWFSLLGLLGISIAFGHSILAMSGEETLAQVYREVESPKLQNFKKAAFIVFIYSLLFTAGISFLAVLIIPDDVRMSQYADNLIGGLAMNVYGSHLARLMLNAFVVIVGSLILSGAVNTAIIGSNGVLNRVAEDGVMPAWFLRPHEWYGTTYRILYLILVMQLFTILVSHGDVLVLGEAYAFGVVWSFVFKALAMVVLRFKDPKPREYKVPLNFRFKGYEVPVGLSLIFVVLLAAAISNLLTKDVATKWGLGFTAGFLVVFMTSEHLHEKRRRGQSHEHVDQFNRREEPDVSAESLGLARTYHKIVAIRSTQNLFMLEKALAETDPDTTDVIVMTAKVAPSDSAVDVEGLLDSYDQQLMTAVVDRAEKAGKKVVPLIVPTNNPLYAVLNTAKDLQAQELVLGVSNKFTAEEQFDQISLYWVSLHQGQPVPLTVRLLSRNRDLSLDLHGGSRIPKLSERRARSTAELRAAGVGVDRVLLVHDGSRQSSDLFQALVTMLDPAVVLDLADVSRDDEREDAAANLVKSDEERAAQLHREVEVRKIADDGAAIVGMASDGSYGLIVLPAHDGELRSDDPAEKSLTRYVLEHARCHVFLAAPPTVPSEVDKE